MKKQDSVFELIKSLTRGEKRNFRMLARLTSGAKKYLQLFDVLDALEEYDEIKILKKFRKDISFEKQFAYNKNYLYNSILNSLAYFHKGLDAELSSLSLQVEILLEKNLFDQARKMLRKVKDRVVSQEKFEDMLKLFRLEVEILRTTENLKLLHESLRRIEVKETITLEKISNLLIYRRLETRMVARLLSENIARSREELKYVDDILAFPEMENEECALSIRGKILYNNISHRIKQFRGEFAEAIPFAKREIELFDAHPAILEDEKLVYLRTVASLAHFQFMTKGLAEAIPALTKIRTAKVSTPKERLFRFQRVYLYYLVMLLDTGEAAPANFLEEFNVELGRLKKELPASVQFLSFYSLAFYHHVQGEHSLALQSINAFLNHPRTNVSMNLQASARIYNLVIHFELGNYDLVAYNLKSASRFISKVDRMGKFERRFLSFLSRAINTKSKPELKKEMLSFQTDIEEIIKDPFEFNATKYFKVEAWLESKIKGIPFAEAVQSANNARIAKEVKIEAS